MAAVLEAALSLAQEAHISMELEVWQFSAIVSQSLASGAVPEPNTAD
jgi:hypothetical protein